MSSGNNLAAPLPPKGYVNPFKVGDMVIMTNVDGLISDYTTLGKMYKVLRLHKGYHGILLDVMGDTGTVVERYAHRFKFANNTFDSFLANKGYLNTKGVFTLTG